MSDFRPGRPDKRLFCGPCCRAAVQVLCFGLLVLTGCSGDQPSPATAGKSKAAAKPLPVRIAVSERRDMPVELRAVGSVEPFAEVGVKSQVEGTLEQVAFREGDMVARGELLFTIDKRPFVARLNQAKAALAKDRAALANARKQLERYRPAAEQGYVSAEQADQAQTDVASFTAAVQADQAAVESAQIALDNCRIRAPLSGYTGELQADRGNLIKAAADQPLVTIRQITPIKVGFSLPETALAEVRKHLAAGSMEVEATPTGGINENGRISFVDNRVAPNSGTIRLKADFPNRDQRLWPGQFVEVRLLLTVHKNATVIPARALQSGQNGDFVYVVSADGKAEQHAVRLAFSVGELAVIETGLAVGETVVTDGQLRLRNGVRVSAIEADGKASQ